MITPTAQATIFDGLTPGTRNVWEAKDGYARIVGPFADLSSQNKRRLQWTSQSNQQNRVSSECGYSLTWAFSEPQVAEWATTFVNARVKFEPYLDDLLRSLF